MLGYTLDDVLRRRHRRDRPRHRDILIYCRIEDISMDSLGNLVLFLSKENKSYLSFLLRQLREHIGKGCSISIRVREDRSYGDEISPKGQD